MIVSIEYCKDLLKTPLSNSLVIVAVFKQVAGVLHYLRRFRAQFAPSYLDIGGVQFMSHPDFPEVMRFGLATLRDDQNAVVTGAPVLFAFELGTLSDFG